MHLPIGPPSVIKLTPEKLDFGSYAVSTASQPRAATLTNTGDSAQCFSDILASGIDFTETDTCKGGWAPGATCSIEVTFTPAITGPLGTIIITHSDPDSPHFLLLAGIRE